MISTTTPPRFEVRLFEVGWGGFETTSIFLRWGGVVMRKTTKIARWGWGGVVEVG